MDLITSCVAAVLIIGVNGYGGKLDLGPVSFGGNADSSGGGFNGNFGGLGGSLKGNPDGSLSGSTSGLSSIPGVGKLFGGGGEIQGKSDGAGQYGGSIGGPGLSINGNNVANVADGPKDAVAQGNSHYGASGSGYGVNQGYVNKPQGETDGKSSLSGSGPLGGLSYTGSGSGPKDGASGTVDHKNEGNGQLNIQAPYGNLNHEGNIGGNLQSNHGGNGQISGSGPLGGLSVGGSGIGINPVGQINNPSGDEQMTVSYGGKINSHAQPTSGALKLSDTNDHVNHNKGDLHSEPIEKGNVGVSGPAVGKQVETATNHATNNKPGYGEVQSNVGGANPLGDLILNGNGNHGGSYGAAGGPKNEISTGPLGGLTLTGNNHGKPEIHAPSVGIAGEEGKGKLNIDGNNSGKHDASVGGTGINNADGNGKISGSGPLGGFQLSGNANNKHEGHVPSIGLNEGGKISESGPLGGISYGGNHKVDTAEAPLGDNKMSGHANNKQDHSPSIGVTNGDGKISGSGPLGGLSLNGNNGKGEISSTGPLGGISLSGTGNNNGKYGGNVASQPAGSGQISGAGPLGGFSLSGNGNNGAQYGANDRGSISLGGHEEVAPKRSAALTLAGNGNYGGNGNSEVEDLGGLGYSAGHKPNGASRVSLGGTKGGVKGAYSGGVKGGFGFGK